MNISASYCATNRNKCNERQFFARRIKIFLYDKNGFNVTNIPIAPNKIHPPVYCPIKDKWEILYPIMIVNDDDVTILLPMPSGPTKRCSNVVKHFLKMKELISSVAHHR